VIRIDLSPELRAQVDKLTHELTAKGQLIEAGFAGLRLMAIAPDAPQIQIDEMRTAFFAGAQHLWASIMTIMDPGEEPTEADMRRMALIEAELKRFGDEFQARHLPTKGSV
jgi:hypothetical protein